MRGLIFSLLIFSTYQLSGQKITGQEYIETYADLAVKEMKRTGIPASITLAQGMLESGNGNSTLAVKGNNHFGIKCHKWDGPGIYHDDDRKNECFRKYKSVYQSYIDHSDFLMNTMRYSFLFEIDPTNYKAWAKGLKRAGYATAHDYDKKLIGIIETHQLYKFDSDEGWEYAKKPNPTPVNDRDYNHQILMNNNIKYIIAREGDSYISLTKEFDLMRWQIGRYNDIPPNSKVNNGDIIYLQPKRKKAAYGEKYHVVKEGESMYSISQKYGIKLTELYKKNLMLEDDEPEIGTKLYLRKKKKGKAPVQTPGNDAQHMEFSFE